MAEPISQPPPRTANVADLQHTPVTLGVVLTVQGVALTAMLLVAGVVWIRVGGLETKIDAVQRDLGRTREELVEIKSEIGRTREDLAEIKALLQQQQRVQP